jgi:plastocyanin
MPRPPSLARQAPTALALAALLVGCGSPAPARPSPAPIVKAEVRAPRPRPGHVTVTIDDYAFRPGRITVSAGTRIRFRNHDQQPHTATFEPASLGNKAILSGASATITLSRPGTYHLYCQFHAFMRATVVVSAT